MQVQIKNFLTNFWLDIYEKLEIFYKILIEKINSRNSLNIQTPFMQTKQQLNAFELIQSGLYTSKWSNPELWAKLFIINIILVGILAIMPLIFSPKKTNIEKNSAYECGFAPFFIKEGVIEIQFIVVALLFLIFDLEIIYMVPFVLNIGNLGSHVLSIFIVYVYVAWGMLALEGLAGAISWPTWLILSDEEKRK